MPTGITTTVGRAPIPFGGISGDHRYARGRRGFAGPCSYASVRSFGDAGQPDAESGVAYTTAVQPSGGIFEQAYISWLRATGQTKAANDLEFPGAQVSADVLAKAEGQTTAATGLNSPGLTLPGIFGSHPLVALGRRRGARRRAARMEALREGQRIAQWHS